MNRHLLTFCTALAILAQSVAALAQVPAAPLAEASSPPEQLVPETNPAVLAALEFPRTKPADYLETVLTLADLKRPELAAPILKELAALNLNDEQRAALVTEFGSHRLLELARNPALAPAGAEFAEACMTAAETRARDPQRLAQLLEQATAGDKNARATARFDLAAAGEPAVIAAVEALARETNPERRTPLSAALVAMNPASIDPLLGMLSTTDPALRRDVIRILKAMHVTLAKPFIVADTSTATAERLLDDAIGRNKRGMRSFVTDENDMAAIWHWDDAAKKLTATRYPIAEAQTIWSARLAIEYARLRPDQRLVQCQALVLGLEADALTGRRTPAVDKLLAEADGEMLNMVLAASMRHDFPRAAVAAADRLGKLGDTAVLYTVSPNAAPLAEALIFPNRRVRFAALTAIMTLDPSASFPGASRVPETLGYFATGASESRAIVAMPVAAQATTLAGRLAALNITGEPASRGAAAVALAQRSADLELILVDADINGPGIRDVLYALRSEPATGQVPIGLLATGSRLDVAHNIADQHQRVVAFPRPQTDAALAELVDRLRAASGREKDSPQERAAMAGQSLEWLGKLLARESTYYDLHRQAPVVTAALYLPAMTERAIFALALLGTPESQRSLVDFASHLSIPIAAREAAANAFAESVQRHGILLTESEILQQYDRYNRSASLDAATQQVFARVLDALESLRAQAEVGRVYPANYQQ